MVEREINEQLVTDINRIMTVAGAWKGTDMESRSCRERESIIEDMLNAGKEAELDASIAKIVDSCTAHQLNGILARSYIKYVHTVLNYRMEAAKSGLKLDKIARSKAGSEFDSYMEMADAMRRAQKTVTGYRALEIAGSAEALAAALSETLGAPVKVTVNELGDPRTVYREKTPYLSHKLWAVTQMLPVVLVEIDA